jgi:hypothetical protein
VEGMAFFPAGDQLGVRGGETESFVDHAATPE